MSLALERSSASKKRPTRRDVALRVGVSETTVSLVLNPDHPDHRIPEETQAKIRVAAEELGYYPHQLVRSLQRGRSQLLAFCSYRGDLNVPFWSEFLSALEKSAFDRNHASLLYLDYKKWFPDGVLPDLQGGLADGILIFGSPSGDAFSQSLAQSCVPAVSLLNEIAGLPCVRQDNENGLFQLVEHLVARGHREMAFLTLPPAYSAQVESRVSAYQSQMEAQGFSTSRHRIFPCHSLEPDAMNRVLEQLLATRPRPTAVLCFSDTWAEAFVCTCQNRGISVPSELAVTGFNGTTCPLATYCLTTYAVSLEELAETAVNLLLDRIAGKAVLAETRIRGILRIGKTT